MALREILRRCGFRREGNRVLRSLSCSCGATGWLRNFVRTATFAKFALLAAGWLVPRPLAEAGGLGAQPAGSGQRQPAAARERDRLVAELTRSLTGSRRRIAAIGPSFLAGRKQDASASDRLTEAQLSGRRADLEFGNAKLAREVAEIGVVEYEEGIAKQDELKIEGELKTAETELRRAIDAVVGTKQRLVKIKAASTGKPDDLALEYAYEDAVADAVRRTPKPARPWSRRS